MKGKVDPELKRQLNAAGEGQRVQAVFTLQSPEGKELYDEKDVARTVDRIVKSAKETSGQEVEQLHVMPRIQSFVVDAPAELVRSLLDAPEIASAMASDQPEDMQIKPVPRPSKGGRRKPQKEDG